MRKQYHAKVTTAKRRDQERTGGRWMREEARQTVLYILIQCLLCSLYLVVI